MKSPLVKVIVCTVALTVLLPACSGPAKPLYENLTQAGSLQPGAYDTVADNLSAATTAFSAGVSTAKMLSAGDYDRAIEAGQGALAASPQDDNLKEKLADAYIARAWYYQAKRLNPYTLDDLFKAVEIAPKYYRAHYELGRFHNNQWQFSIGLMDLNKALSLKPDYAPAYSERGYSNYKNRKYEAALADVNKAIELDAGDGQFYYMRSLVYRGMGKDDLAIGDLEAAIRLSKDPSLAEKAAADMLLLRPR
jgi:tetratricopeptide (TPR) repeat protein